MKRTMRSTPRTSICCLVFLCLMSGCGALRTENSSSNPSTSSEMSTLAVTPTAPKIRTGNTQLFVATSISPQQIHPGSSTVKPAVVASNLVTWSVNGIAGGNATLGTINATGLYTVPVTIPSPNTIRVAATNTSDLSVSVAALVTLENPIPTLVSVSPTTVPVGSFTLTVNGGSLVRGAQVLFDGAPLQTTFDSPTQLTATGVATHAQLGNIEISITNPGPGASSATNLSVQVNTPPAIQVSVNPPSASIRVMNAQQFTATVQGTSNVATTWSVNGIPGGTAAVGTVSSTGLYIAPATLPASNSVKVTATSVASPSISATVPLTLSNPVPIVAAVTPNSLAPGSFTLAISGSKFVTGAQIFFAGLPLKTTFSSGTRLTATGTATKAQTGKGAGSRPKP